MKRILLISFVVSILTVSCQKEADFDNRTQTGDLLVRAEEVKDGGDSTTSSLEYDANDKLVKISSRIFFNGTLQATQTETFTRDASGMITKIRYDAIDPADSYTIFTHSSNGKYVYSIRQDEDGMGGVYITDSAVYEYNANGKIIKEREFIPATGEQHSLIEYKYDANGNVYQYLFFETYGGTMDLIETVDFTFDNRTNPIAFGNESMIRQDYGLSAHVNNPLSVISSNMGVPGYTFTYTYTYNSAGKPVAGTFSYDFGDGIMRYFYQ